MRTSRPGHTVFIYTAIFMVLCSFLLIKQTFDIRIFDTFYVFALKTIYWIVAFLLLVLWGIYRLADMFIPSASLKRYNIILTVLASILIVVFHTWSRQLSFSNKPYPINDVPLFYRNNIKLLVLLFFFALAQIPLAINIIRGIIRILKEGTGGAREANRQS